MEQTTDKDFIIDCLCWHNEYRARHSVPALNISMKLCVSAQEWVCFYIKCKGNRLFKNIISRLII